MTAAEPEEMTDVTCAIIIEKERVLVTQRSELMPHALKWEFPGGKVKAGESPERCIKREISEELGLEIEIVRLLPSTTHAYNTHTIRLIPFICTATEGEITLSEHKSFRWVSIHELTELDWLDADVEVARVLQGHLKSKMTGGAWLTGGTS